MVTANCYVVVRPLKVTAPRSLLLFQEELRSRPLKGPWLHSMASQSAY